MTYNVATALASSPNPYSSPPATTFTPSDGMSAFIALDYAHNILWMSGGSGIIGVNSGSSGTIPTLETAVTSNVAGLAVDSSGNVYVCVNSSSIEIFPYGSTTATTTISLGFTNNCHGLAVDSGGNIYIADPYTNGVEVIAAPGLAAGSISATFSRQITSAAAGTSKAWNIAVDSSGQIYLVDSTKNEIFVFAAGVSSGSSTPLTVINAFSGGTVSGIAIDANNNVLASDLYQILIFTPLQISNAISGSTSVLYADETITNASFTTAVGIAAH